MSRFDRVPRSRELAKRKTFFLWRRDDRGPRPLLVLRGAFVVLVGTAAVGLGAGSASAAITTVTLDGTASGSVVSSPPGINCSNVPGAVQTACSFTFPDLTTIKLTATAAAGAVLKGWAGTAGGTCSGVVNPCSTGVVFGNPMDVTATFSPAPDRPVVTTGGASEIVDPSATLSGTVNPSSSEFATAGCFFEFGPTTEYGTTTPCRPGTAGPGTSAVAVTGSAGGLEPGVTYHYRLVASNAGGSSVGADRTFVSAPARADDCPNAAIRAQQSAIARTLSDCMAYEMVTPRDTQGQRGRGGMNADGGNTVYYSSVGGFAGTPNLPVLGAQYVARRGESGWVTTAISPPASDFPYLGYGNLVDHTDDLTSFLWNGNTAEDAGTQRFTAIVREADGTVTVAGPTIEGFGADNAVVGTSADLRSVVIASTYRPALTDGTVDARAGTRNSLVVATRSSGGVEVRQVAYKDNATMFAACGLRLGGSFVRDGTTERGAISGDGSKIFFSPFGSPTGTCQAAANQRVWVKVGTADPIDLAQSQCTTNCGAVQRAGFEGAARNGSRAYFTTEQKLVDGDQDTSTKNDLYEYDFNAPGNKLIPVTASASAAGAGVVRVTRVSADGSHVYFVANGRPLTGPNTRNVAPLPGDNNLYAYRREPGQATGTIAFIAALDPADAALWDGDTRRGIQTSRSGRYMIFSSVGDLTGDRLPGDAHPDIFRYDALTDDLRRIWTDDPAHNGTDRSDGSFLAARFGGDGQGGRQMYWNSNQISDDGATIGFDTVERLSPNDINAERDAYVWRAETGAVTMLTSGRSRTRADFVGMSPRGDRLFVLTSAPLVKEHTSGSVATYAIVRGGGFASAPGPPLPCVGDACQGAGEQPRSPLPLMGSGVFNGSGNVAPLVEGQRQKLKVSKPKSIRGSSGTITVKVPSKGRIQTSGSGVVRRSMSAGKAGTYKAPVRLSSRSQRTLTRKHRVNVWVTVRFSSSQDGRSTARVLVKFAKKATKQPSTPGASDRRTAAQSVATEKGR